jgi:hypothetical protein
MDLNLINNSATEKQKRRSKTDQVDRNFVCGCGKSYLSYPALYTHIKTKHEGASPEGTSSNLFSNSKKRGRPRKQLDDVDPDKLLADLDMFGGFCDAKSELVDSPLYEYIVHWETCKEYPEKNINCDDAFGMYLIDAAKVVNAQNFYQIVKFVESFRKCVETNDTFKMPERLEYFIQHYIPLYIPSFDRELAIKLAMHFSQWLLSKKLTDVKLVLI